MNWSDFPSVLRAAFNSLGEAISQKRVIGSEYYRDDTGRSVEDRLRALYEARKRFAEGPQSQVEIDRLRRQIYEIVNLITAAPLSRPKEVS